MTDFVSKLGGLLLKVGIVAFLVNEVRGFILAAPVLYMMYEAGGTWMALWLGVCSLAGIALSVVLPVYAARKLQVRFARAN
jgi:hypothetical protein